jgi:hypothetical protein
VVETDPVTWVRLATGRLGWAEAVGAGTVRASGPRADLSAYLPVALCVIPGGVTACQSVELQQPAALRPDTWRRYG